MDTTLTSKTDKGTRLTLRKLAREVYLEHPEEEGFVNALLGKMRRNRLLREEAFRVAAADAYRQATWDQRTRMVEDAGKQPQRTYAPTIVKKVAQGAAAWLERGSPYSFPLWGGTPLGDATLEELAHSREKWKSLAKNNAARARFVELVEAAVKDKLPTGGKVREALPEEDAAALMRKAFG